MKKIFLTIVCLSVYFLSYAQIFYLDGPDVYTCKGGIIQTIIPNRNLNSAELAQIDFSFFNPSGNYYYLGIQRSDIISDPSTYYNCHAYAWHLKEGNSNQVWINGCLKNSNISDSNISKYWDSDVGCFIQVSESEAEKIFYYNGDHSAIKSNVPGKYESKWGNLFVVRHGPNQVPYANSNNRKYYKKYVPQLSGPPIVCKNQSFTVSLNDLPAGCSVTWSYSSFFTKISSSGSQAVFRATSGDYGSISATVTGNGLNISVPALSVSIDKPHYNDVSLNIWNGSTGAFLGNTANGSIGVCPNTTYHVRVVNNSSCSLSNYNWILPAAWQKFQSDETGYLSFNTRSASGGRIELTANTCCATSQHILTTYLMGASNCPSYMRAILNPTKKEVTVELNEDEFEIRSEGVFEIELWSSTAVIRRYTTDQTSYTFSVADLPAGLYIVRVIIDGQIYTQKVLKE